MPYRGMGDYGGRGDGFLGSFGKVLGTGFKLAKAIAGGPASVAMARLQMGHAPGATAPIGSSVHGTPHTHSAAIDTFLRRGGRFTAAGKGKLTKQHAELLAAGVHPRHLLGGGRRRMNWANPKALGRAERRISSALKHFTRFFRWAHPGKHAGHAVPKFHRKGSKTR